MIISASRRTDIPAFYPAWFMNRIQAGYCTTVNPFNHNQVSYVSLKPEDVDLIVFWTKNPEPFIKHLKELDKMGYHYYFQYTLTGYPPIFEPNVPTVEKSIKTFKKLADLIGPDRLIWRYDPVIISNITGINDHKRQIDYIAGELEGCTERLMISLVDEYQQWNRNLKRLEKQAIFVNQQTREIDVQALITFMVALAQNRKMEVFSCAEKLDLTPFGLKPGKCIDDAYIRKVFGLEVSAQKDPSQRVQCACVRSKDIGAYNTCFHGCLYCYAGTLSAAQKSRMNHDVNSPSMIGHYEAEPPESGLEQPALF